MYQAVYQPSVGQHVSWCVSSLSNFIHEHEAFFLVQNYKVMQPQSPLISINTLFWQAPSFLFLSATLQADTHFKCIMRQVSIVDTVKN